MENAEWGRNRPLSVTPEPKAEPAGTPPPSLFSMAAAPPEPAVSPSASRLAKPVEPVKPVQQEPALTEARDSGEENVDFDFAGSGPTAKYMALRIFKVVMIGDSGAGKTTFVQHLCQGTVAADTRSTVGVDYFSKLVRVDKQDTSLKIWDTAGTEKYRSISRSFLRDADAVILLYDITNTNSFSNAHSWMVDVQEKARPNVVVMLTGNKIDLAEEGSRLKDVPQNIGSSVADSYNALFAEISALTGEGVQASCISLVRALHRTEDEEMSKTRDLAQRLADGQAIDSSMTLDDKSKATGCCT